MAKFDPNRYEQQFMSWRNKGSLMPIITPENRQLILDYIADMEIGLNVNPASRKGARSFCSLQSIYTKMNTLTILLEKELQIKSFADIKDLDLIRFFKNLRDGKFNRRDKAEPIVAAGTYVTMFKAFWHWYMRVQRKKNIIIEDITLDLDATCIKPKFNYFTVDDLRSIANESNHFYRILMWFMFDSGIRLPTELMNIRVSDLEWTDGFYALNIRDETSKTFGRKIKLLLCSEMLRDYIKNRNLTADTYIFKRDPAHINQYLKNIGYKLLKIGTAKEQTYENGRKQTNVINGLTMYDFRHSSACFWLPRYKSESAMKYRFGWKKSEMIEYYTSYLGMRDTVTKDDLYVGKDKPALERQLKELDAQKALLQEQMESSKREIDAMLKEARALVKERTEL